MWPSRPGGRSSGRLGGLRIAALVAVSAALGAGVTGMVAAGSAEEARVSAARDLADMKAGRVLAELRADACLAAFAHDRAALEEMFESAGDLHTALGALDAAGWPAARVLVGSAAAHLEESKKSIVQANAAECTG